MCGGRYDGSKKPTGIISRRKSGRKKKAGQFQIQKNRICAPSWEFGLPVTCRELANTRAQMEMGRLYGQSSWPPWGGLTGSVRRGALSEKQVDDWQKLPSVADRTFMTHEIMQCLRSPIQPVYPVDTRVGRNLIDRSYD
jgi:hypothetical protein